MRNQKDKITLDPRDWALAVPCDAAIKRFLHLIYAPVAIALVGLVAPFVKLVNNNNNNNDKESLFQIKSSFLFSF